MQVTGDPKTLGRARLSFASEADIDEFVDVLDKFERGELTPDQWRVFRLVRGTYGQRQTGDVQMLRVKVPQGILTAAQLETLADVGERFSRGFGHITTRQNIQFHFVKLHDVEPAMRMLADAGVTTREACGNSVRNITCCPLAGVSPTEVFDVTPYAEATTRYLLRHPLSSSLPRKFKIAFEGCTDEDHALLGMHDLGFRAEIRGGTRGFRIVVGGGTSIMVKSAASLHDWLPANGRKQKQGGCFLATATIPLGDLTSQQMRILGDLATAFGDGTLRVTAEQDLVFRWVPTDAVPELYRQLAAAGMGLADAGTIADVTSCPGAESCKLAVTQSRGLGKFLGDYLRERPDLVAAAPDLQIKISGCPNGCGRNHIAGLGFQGSVRKLGGKAVPQYFVTVGGGPEPGGGDGVRFGRLAAKIPARRMTEALERLITLYGDERRPGESATEFFMRVEVDRVKQTLADLEKMTIADTIPEDFVDLAETSEFNPEIQEGECSA